MTKGYFITGTDTDVGKTVAASWMMLHLDGQYWKPIQSGLEGPVDKDSVRHLTQLSDDRFCPCTYELQQPLSPHEAARRDGVRIDLDAFSLPASDRPLIVEGAGGVLVPINEKHFVIDLIAHLQLPTVVVCRSTLGTINHTLTTLEALRSRHIPIAGLIINGPKTPHNRQALVEYGNVPIIAEMDWFEDLNKEALLSVQPEINLETLKAAA